MPNILIVEDEEAIRRGLKKVLIEDDSKNNIIEATDGSDAINKIKSENLELVICDIKMPKKDGMDVLNFLKSYDDKIPIISPLGLQKDQTYNINGDVAAGKIAQSLKCRRLLLMTNVEGVLDKDKKLIEEISSSKILEMVKNETITGGMIPKINMGLESINNGVTAVGIIDARPKHSILFELFSDKGSGTLIRK